MTPKKANQTIGFKANNINIIVLALGDRHLGLARVRG